LFRTSSGSYIVKRLERDADRNSGPAGIAAIIQVIPVIGVIHVDIICLVPVGAPIIRIRIKSGKPVAAVLKARVPVEFHEGETVNAEIMTRAIVAGEIDGRNAEAIVPAALLPTTVLGIKVAGTVSLPRALLQVLL